MESIAMQMAKIIYPNQNIVDAKIYEDGILEVSLEMDKPINYISFTTEVVESVNAP